MKHATSIALHAYWQSCQRQSGVRAAFLDAVELAPILPSLFLLDLGVKRRPTFRFCGANIALRYGRDLAGEPFLPLWTAADREVLAQHVGTLALESGGLVAGVLGETAAGGFTSFEMLLLPLVGDDGLTGAIGSMARTGGHDEVNRIRARLVDQSLQSLRFLPAADGPLPWRAEAGPAVADESAPGLRRYRHLTLLSGGKQGEPSCPAVSVTDF